MDKKGTSVFSNSLIWFGAGVSIAEIVTGTYLASLGMAKGISCRINWCKNKEKCHGNCKNQFR